MGHASQSKWVAWLLTQMIYTDSPCEWLISKSGNCKIWLEPILRINERQANKYPIEIIYLGIHSVGLVELLLPGHIYLLAIYLRMSSFILHYLLFCISLRYLAILHG